MFMLNELMLKKSNKEKAFLTIPYHELSVWTALLSKISINLC